MSNRVFDYRQLCKSQEIAVQIPEGTVVDVAEVDILVDMLLKSIRLFNKIERLRQSSIAELNFAQTANGQIRVNYTNDTASLANLAFQELESPSGLNTTIKQLSKRNLSSGFTVTRMLASNAVNILYTQIRSIMTFIITKNNQYEKFGSEKGYLPYLNAENCVSILEKAVHMQNHIYDLIYVLGNVAITSLSGVYGQNTPVELQNRLKQYEIYEGEGQNAINVMLKSFDPSVRFVVSEGEDIIFNF